MPPRDMWDMNPVYTLSFWESYLELLERIGFRTSEEDPDVVELWLPDLIADEGPDLVAYEDMPDLEDWGDDLGDLPTLEDFM